MLQFLVGIMSAIIVRIRLYFTLARALTFVMLQRNRSMRTKYLNAV
jgi:hypothetical protein